MHIVVIKYFPLVSTGYGNVAPKTTGGRILCIIYGLFGIPLCLVWVSEVGSFFRNRAMRLSGVMLDKGVSVVRADLNIFSMCQNSEVCIVCAIMMLLFSFFFVRKKSR